MITARISCNSKGMLPIRYPIVTCVIYGKCLDIYLKKKWFYYLGI